MKTILVILILLQSVISFGQNIGDQLFENSIVHELEIVSQYNGSLIDSLNIRHQNERIQEIDWSYMQVDAYFDGEFVDSIGLRLKGGDVSYSTVKPSLKIDLNEFVSGKRYDGLKKINVDNCLHDPSLMREKLYYDIATELGLKSSRTSFVKVIIDGVSYGNYVYIEQVNKQFLEGKFGNNDGNLFKARGGGNLNLYGANTQDDYPWSYELKTNETENDWSDLLLLIDKVNNTPSANFKDTITKYLNVDAVLDYMALGTFVVYSDNIFSGGNNGYWYHNTVTNKFEIIPWDIDLSFMDNEIIGYQYSASNAELINPVVNHSVFEKLLGVPEFRTSYLEKCCFIHNHLGHQDALKSKIDDYKTLLQNASITPDANCDYTIFSDPSDVYILDYLFLGLKDFAEIRHQKMSSEFSVYDFSCLATTSVNSIGNNLSFSIYPNPASDVIYFDLNENEEDVEGSIINSIGQTVLTYQHLPQEINIDNLKPGLYTIVIQNETVRRMLKFIKE